jgi:hypothetical protein
MVSWYKSVKSGEIIMSSSQKVTPFKKTGIIEDSLSL